jgi:putative ABC transport system permease protein
MTRRRMGILAIALRSLRQHRLSTVVTVASVALATGLVMAVFAIEDQSRRAFTTVDAGGFDAVLGARGSPIQLVLNAVYHLDSSPGNLPYALYLAIAADPRVAEAVPYALGDNYYGYRIVGTTAGLFIGMAGIDGDGGSEGGARPEGDAGATRLAPAQVGQPSPRYPLSAGRLFDPGRMEAVIGSEVARRAGLGLGDVFNPYHGLIFDPASRHDEQYVVVGIMKPTNSPVDRVIWIPLEGIYRMSGHVLRGTGEEYEAQAGLEIPDEHKEVSAVMLRLRTPQAGFALEQTINRQGRVATLAWPIGTVMADLFERFGWLTRVLELVAYLVMVVAAASILASIAHSLDERRREFAILRAIGARRRTVLGVILFEAGGLAAMGALLGYLVYVAILVAVQQVVRDQTGVVLEIARRQAVLVQAPLSMIVLGLAAGLVPAVRAYATDVASNLVRRT